MELRNHECRKLLPCMLCKDHPIQSKWLLVSSGGHLTWWKISYTAEVVLCNIRPDKVPLNFTRKYQTGLYDGLKIHIIGSCKIVTAQNNNVAMLQMMGCRSNSTPGLFKDGGRARDGTTENGEHLTSLWVEKTSQSTIDARQWVVPHLKTWHQSGNTVHWLCSGVSSHPVYCSLVVLWSLITPHLLFLCGAVKSHHTVPSVPWWCYGIW